jgi:hypothetical protein
MRNLPDGQNRSASTVRTGSSVAKATAGAENSSFQLFKMPKRQNASLASFFVI